MLYYATFTRNICKNFLSRLPKTSINSSCCSPLNTTPRQTSSMLSFFYKTLKLNNFSSSKLTSFAFKKTPHLLLSQPYTYSSDCCRLGVARLDLDHSSSGIIPSTAFGSSVTQALQSTLYYLSQHIVVIDLM